MTGPPGALEARPVVPAVGAAAAPVVAAEVAVEAVAAVGFGAAATVAVGAGGALVGAGGLVGALWAGALHAASSGRPMEPTPRMPSTWRRVARPEDMAASVPRRSG